MYVNGTDRYQEACYVVEKVVREDGLITNQNSRTFIVFPIQVTMAPLFFIYRSVNTEAAVLKMDTQH